MGGGKRDFMRTHCEPTFHHNRWLFYKRGLQASNNSVTSQTKNGWSEDLFGFFCISGNSFQPKRRPFLSWELADNISPILTTI